MKKAKRVIIAAGGSGGHIYPALALAHAFLKLYPETQVHFWGSHGGMENRIVPQNGFSLKTIPIGRLQSNVSYLERLTTVFLLPLALLRALLFLLNYRPHLVLGVGGHASGPLLLVSSLLRTFQIFHISNAIWEPNAMPGLTNRWLSRFVQKNLIVFKEAEKYLKTSSVSISTIHFVGMPVREEIKPSQAKIKMHKKFRIFIFGGSQGSVAINEVIGRTFQNQGATEENQCQEKNEWKKNLQVVHQTGIKNFDKFNNIYPSNMNIEVVPYIDNMGERYAWADLVICRSGTGTLFELAASGCPSILIPLPTAANDHQKKNAEVFHKSGAAIMILQNDFNELTLKKAIIELQTNFEKRNLMSRKAHQFHKPHAAENIVKILNENIDDKTKGNESV